MGRCYTQACPGHQLTALEMHYWDQTLSVSVSAGILVKQTEDISKKIISKQSCTAES